MSTLEVTPALSALRTLRAQELNLQQAKRALIARARRDGASWEDVGTALGVSRQAAWEMYNREISALLDQTADRMQLSEDDAMAIALEEVSAVRRARQTRQRS